MSFPHLLRIASISLVLALACAGSALGAEPHFKERHARFLGPDRYWRSRETLVFHLYDDKGTGFKLDVAVRDMNVYMQGKRPALIWVTDPQSRTVFRTVLEDDGIVSGNHRAKDGLSDVYLDFRYREWHRMHTPGGYPEGKERSPFLKAPETIPVRHVTADIPAKGKGLYRVMVVASWDHWFSVTPDRPMPAGIHGGPGPLYVHGDQLDEAWAWVPGNANHLAFTVSEEIEPFNWTLTVQNAGGKLLGRTEPKTFFNFTILDNPPKDDVIKLGLNGNTTGALLHWRGFPMVLTPDEPSARLIKGGILEMDGDRPIYHHYQKALKDWLAADGRRAPADTRKQLTDIFLPAILKQGTFFWFKDTEGPWTHNPEATGLWAAAFRSNWYPMHVRAGFSDLGKFNATLKEHLPADIYEALITPYLNFVITRTTLHQGECTNQWAAAMRDIDEAYKALGDPVTKEVLWEQVRRICTVNNLGRSAPDLTPYSFKSKVGYGAAADIGIIGGGVPADGLGHDNQYGLETTAHMAHIWQTTGQDDVVKWLELYYDLKTHLTMPKFGEHTTNIFGGTISPSDMNFRTGFTTHKSPIGQIHNLIRYGDLWAGTENPKEPWPCLAAEPFVKNIDNKYYFVKTPGYYAILYGGNALYSFANFTRSMTEGNSARLVGYSGMHYTGIGRKASKLAGLSALFVPGCGPTLITQNHNVMFSNTVWGRLREPFVDVVEEGHVDPRVICSGYATPQFTFDEKTRIATRIEKVEYAPLVVKRTSQLKDDRIVVDLELTATGDLDTTELYECLPYMVDQRKLTVFETKLTDPGKAFPIPKPNEIPGYWKGVPAVELRGENLNLTKPTFMALAIESGNGAGSMVIFDKPYRFVQSQPIKHRTGPVAAIGAFNLPLPTSMKAGQTHSLRYVIVSYDKRPDADTLTRIAREEKLQ